MDYIGYLKSLKRISFAEALDVMVPLFVKVHKWNIGDNIKKVNSEKYNTLKELFIQLADRKIVDGEVSRYEKEDIYGQPEVDFYGGPIIEVSLRDSYFEAEKFYAYMKWYLLYYDSEVPEELNILASNSGDSTTGNAKNATKDIVEKQLIDADIDSKYPTYDNLDINNPNKKLLEGIKKNYGMLRREVIKLKSAIPIATKIGLLFYEHNLNKPTTKPAFIAAYKKEFDAMLKNDTLAKEIYRNLPEEYRSASGSPGNAVDLMPIIKAAVYAGSIYDTEDVKIPEKLKIDLVEYFNATGYQVPTDDVLLKIIEAVKDL